MTEEVNGSDIPRTAGCPLMRFAALAPLFLVVAAAGFALAASLAVSVGGFAWGLPCEKHIQSYHPDEQNVTYSLRNMKPREFDFNPRFFGNPTFYTYQVGALAAAASLAGVLPRRMEEDYWLAHPESVRRFYVLGRGLSLLYAAGALVLIFMAARRLGCGRPGAALAAVVLASLPAFAVHSHYMTVNASAVFWSLAALVSALRLRERPSWANYVWAGAFAGLAISTKLNNAFLPFAIAAAHLQATRGRPFTARLFSGRLWAAGAVCLAAFFAGSPYYLLSFGCVRADPHHQMNLAAFFSLADPPGKVLADFWNHLEASCGSVMAVGLLVAAPAALVLHGRRSAPVPAVALPFLAVAVKSGWWAFPSRMLPLLALLSLLAAFLFSQCLRQGALKFAAAAVLAAGLAWAGVWNAAYFNLMRAEHIREASSEWITRNIPAGQTVIVLDTPYFDDPNILYEAALHPETGRAASYEIANLGGDYASIDAAAGNWLVVPQRFEEKLRRAGYGGIAHYAEAHGFTLEKKFSRDFAAFGLELRDWVPADMVQQYQVYVFKRRRGATQTAGEFLWTPPRDLI